MDSDLWIVHQKAYSLWGEQIDKTGLLDSKIKLSSLIVIMKFAKTISSYCGNQ